MIKLKGVAPYRSIPAFEQVNLPDLVVLIGLNGSGKTHLLQGILAGQVAVAIDTGDFPPHTVPPMPNHRGIVLLQNGDPWPMAWSEEVASRITGTPATHPTVPWRSDNDPAVGGFAQSRHQAFAEPLARFQEAFGGKLTEIVPEIDDLWSLDPLDITARGQAAGVTVSAEFVIGQYKAAEKRLLDIPGLGIKLRYTSNRLNIPVLKLTAEHLRANVPWAHVQPFEPPLVQAFARYRDLRIENDLLAAADVRDGTSNALSAPDFVAKHGDAPWELITKALTAFDLPYRVAEPDPHPAMPSKFVLRRLDNDAVVQIDGLSSGERVLLRLAVSLFDFDQIAVTVSTPDLLLLDEMDASLHPEMVQRWLHGLHAGVVDRLGIKVILTTHSPTTVALAPDEAIFQMVYGEPGPRKVTKQQALNALTFGLPTLSIDYSGRRQVFVESDTDAATYDILTSTMKARLGLPRTLTFISTGIREKNVEHNTGCAVVRSLVEQLYGNGASSIFGVLDWDGGANVSDDRVRVVGEGTHYALDNLLLDPLLICALLLREDRPPQGVSIVFAQLGLCPPIERQALADAIVAAVLSGSSEPVTMTSNAYADGTTIQLPAEWNTMRGHDLEDLVVKRFPVLNKWNGKGRGKMTEAVARLVVRDYPDLCPKPIANLLVALAS